MCQKMMRNNPCVDLVTINTYTKYGQILLIHSQNIERKQNSELSVKSHNSITNVQKMCNNHNLDIVNINLLRKFGPSQEVERK